MARPTVASLAQELGEIRKHLDTMAATQLAIAAPIDADKLRFAPRVLIAIAAACLAVGGTQYFSNSGVRDVLAQQSSDIRNILTRMESKEKLDEANQRLLDVQSAARDKAIDTIDKQQKLQALEMQSLKEMVLKQGVK